jgi:hypothetical protein
MGTVTKNSMYLTYQLTGAQSFYFYYFSLGLLAFLFCMSMGLIDRSVRVLFPGPLYQKILKDEKLMAVLVLVLLVAYFLLWPLTVVVTVVLSLPKR